MTKIVTIVEGEGEVEALPILLRKLFGYEQYVELPLPKRAGNRNNLTKAGGLEYFLELARREPRCDGALVLLDADKDCAAELAWDLAERARALGLPFPVAVVCAKCEYEAWFLASLETIAGHYGIPENAQYSDPVETKRGVKEWLQGQMPSGHAYKETLHQVRMTELLDPAHVRERSRSFRRLEHALDELLAGEPAVTPQRPI